MSPGLQFEADTVNQWFIEEKYDSLTEYLKNSFKLKRDEKGVPVRYDFSREAITTLVNLLEKIEHKSLNARALNLYKEIYRSLRNYVINPQVQSHLSQDKHFLTKTELLLKKIKEKECLQIILQFLINLIISNKQSASDISEIFNETILDILEKRFCVYEASALIYNISLHKSVDQMSFNNYILIFELYEEDNSIEFLHFLLENYVLHTDFWVFYKNFPVTYRVTALEILRHKQIKENTLKIPEDAVKIISKLFTDSCDVIFQTAKSSDCDLGAYEVSLLLEIVSCLCGDERCLKILQNDKDLLINSGVVLINIHRLGKESDNYFSAIQRLSEVREPNDVIKEHPAFGFKAGLVRVIGNLCWKNETMQNLVREAELIPVILDCCNMDARNPFIMQWVILAVRNLCDGNLKNQEIIAGMHQEGSVSSAALEEMGLTIHSDGDKSIKVVSLDALQKR